MARTERITQRDEDAAWSIFSPRDNKGFSRTDCTSFALVQRLELLLCVAIDADFRAFSPHSIPAGRQ